MSSREAILRKVKSAQPTLLPLPAVTVPHCDGDNTTKFKTILESIGGKLAFVSPGESLEDKVSALFPAVKRVVSFVSEVESYHLPAYTEVRQHTLHDVDVAIIKAQFGVAENGAVWVTGEDLKIRVLPFICEHLVAVLDATSIIPTMHHAYERVGAADYGFGVFIAGPSKTADIEQSLVLGAHGPKSITVLIRS